MKKVLILFMQIIAPCLIYGQIPDCSDLFISEHIDGSSKNKAVEIFNASDNDVDLSHYSIRVFMNGAPTPLETSLSGILPPRYVFVLAHPLASSEILAVANLTSNKFNPNGDDAIVLLKDGVMIDAVGEVGVDPGPSGWAAGTGSTKRFSLIRKAACKKGQSSWTICKNEWETYALDDISNLGWHSSSCRYSGGYEVEFVVFPPTIIPEAACVGAGTDCFPVQAKLTPAIGIMDPPKTIDLFHFCDATDKIDYLLFPFTNLKFYTGSPYSWLTYLNILDDAIYEGDEEGCFDMKLIDPSIDCIVNCRVSFTIIDDETISIDPKIEFSKLEMFPNPASTEVWFRGISGKGVLSVTNAIGQEVMNMESSDLANLHPDVSELANGIYWMKVKQFAPSSSLPDKYFAGRLIKF